MRHVFPGVAISLSIMLVIIFTQANIATAKSPLTKPFGGEILDTKSIQIRAYESAGFVCTVPGKTITIRPVGAYPVEYLIPVAVRSKTKFPIISGQKILGNYSQTVTPITCVMPETGATVSVQLHPITLFGTSKSPIGK